jgi:hypothetical protein
LASSTFLVVEEVWVNARMLARKCGCLPWQISNASLSRGRVAPGLAGFLGFRRLALTGLRALAGPMPSGVPAAAGVTVDSGSGLKNARHPGVS